MAYRNNDLIARNAGLDHKPCRPYIFRSDLFSGQEVSFTIQDVNKRNKIVFFIEKKTKT